MKYLYLILLSSLFMSCGVFKTKPKNIVKLNSENANKLNGTYSVFALDKLKSEYPYYHNANNKFYRKYGRGQSDTISFDTITGGRFKIKIIDKQNLQIDFLKENDTIKSQKIEYKFKTDGFLYLKNRNTIISGIPYLFGGVDVKKVRIALNHNDDLILNDIFDSSGALLLIFGDAKVWEETNIYERLDE